MPRVGALANPTLLQWARRRAGYSTEEAAEKLRVSVERFSSWEDGSAPPTVKQLRRAGSVCRLPDAVFYLPEPPGPGPQPIRDFRRHWGADPRPISPQLRGEIESACKRQELAVDLLELDDEQAP